MALQLVQALHGCSPQTCLLQGYTTRAESPEIIKQELAGVTSAAFGADDVEEDQDDDGSMTEFRVRTSLVLREAVAQLTVEEGSMLELALQLPPCWPLKPATIEPRRKVESLTAAVSQQHLLSLPWGAFILA